MDRHLELSEAGVFPSCHQPPSLHADHLRGIPYGDNERYPVEDGDICGGVVDSCLPGFLGEGDVSGGTGSSQCPKEPLCA